MRVNSKNLTLDQILAKFISEVESYKKKIESECDVDIPDILVQAYEILDAAISKYSFKPEHINQFVN